MKSQARQGLSKTQRAFLAAYRATASITKAADAAKVNRTRHYQWLAEDAGYAAAFEIASGEAAQLLEDEALRRAHEGVNEPVVYQGEFTFPLVEVRDADGNVVRDEAGNALRERSTRPLVIRKYSDALLMFLLKGRMPGVYRDRGAVEVSGPLGGPIPLEAQGLAVLDKDELTALRDLARKITAAACDRSGDRAAEPE